MPISPKLPLSLEQIARFWSQELQPQENSYEVLAVLTAALVRQDLSSLDPADELRQGVDWAVDAFGTTIDAVCRQLASGVESKTGNIPPLRTIYLLRITRDELMRWAAEQGYPPPIFWDAASKQQLNDWAVAAVKTAKTAAYEATNPLPPPGTLRPFHPDDHRPFTKLVVYKKSPADPEEASAAGPPPTAPPWKYCRDAWIAKAAKRPHKGSWQELCDECRNDCDGWKDEKKKLAARGFNDATITKLVRKARKKADA